MDIQKMLSQLRVELHAIEEAIVVMERLALGGRKGRGRPPAWLTALKARHAKGRGQPPGGTNTPRRGT
jgi:hypothetical protein